MNSTCYTCDGSGILIRLKIGICDYCEGTGNGCDCGDICLICYGHGKLIYRETYKCKICNGKGIS
jgi:DnaJ-class molecular chaperone